MAPEFAPAVFGWPASNHRETWPTLEHYYQGQKSDDFEKKVSQVSQMAQEHTCDCCKHSVEGVSEVGLCFMCETFQTFTAIIKEETDLNDGDALDLAGVLSDHILSATVERLQVSHQRLTSKDGAVGTVTLA
jgi:hypothetical protein